MGLSRLSTDSSLPNRNWLRLLVTLATNSTAQVFSATAKYAIRAVVYAPSDNATNVVIAPSSGVLTTDKQKIMTPGDEYLIESEPGHSYDLAAWYAIATNAAGSPLVIFYQPAN